MADRYLLESGSPDGYTLEDGSGVLLLEQVSGDIAGTTSLDFTQAGVLAGSGALLSTPSPLTFDQAAVLQGTGVMDGVVALLFDLLGTMEQPGGFGLVFRNLGISLEIGI